MVKRHVNQIYRKLGVKNRVQLANAVRDAAGPPHPPDVT